MTSLVDALSDMAAALEPLTLEVEGLQITAGFQPNPTLPSIDIYPATPFQHGAGFGVGSKLVRWVVRARVSTADVPSANLTLLRLMDPNDPASVEAALAVDQTAVLGNDGAVSGFVQFTDDAGRDMLGVSWDGMEMYV
jgi:hypothetical protein